MGQQVAKADEEVPDPDQRKRVCIDEESPKCRDGRKVCPSTDAISLTPSSTLFIEKTSAKLSSEQLINQGTSTKPENELCLWNIDVYNRIRVRPPFIDGFNERLGKQFELSNSHVFLENLGPDILSVKNLWEEAHPLQKKRNVYYVDHRLFPEFFSFTVIGNGNIQVSMNAVPTPNCENHESPALQPA